MENAGFVVFILARCMIRYFWWANNVHNRAVQKNPNVIFSFFVIEIQNYGLHLLKSWRPWSHFRSRIPFLKHRENRPIGLHKCSCDPRNNEAVQVIGWIRDRCLQISKDSDSFVFLGLIMWSYRFFCFFCILVFVFVSFCKFVLYHLVMNTCL